MKEQIATIMLAFVLGNGTAGGAMKFYADHTYISMSDYSKSVVQSRIWVLQDRIKTIKRNAARANRPLTTAEKLDIEEIQIEINELKGE